MNLTKLTNYSIGLTDKEVLENREKHGMNLLTPPKKASMWKLYLEKFNDPVIRILLVAAFFSLVISIIEGEYAETIGIFFAIFLATGIGFYFEYDANKKFELLNAVGEETPVTVRRNGKIQCHPPPLPCVESLVFFRFCVQLQGSLRLPHSAVRTSCWRHIQNKSRCL